MAKRRPVTAAVAGVILGLIAFVACNDDQPACATPTPRPVPTARSEYTPPHVWGRPSRLSVPATTAVAQTPRRCIPVDDD